MARPVRVSPGPGNGVIIRIGSDAELIASFSPQGVTVQAVTVIQAKRRQGLAKQMYEELGRVMRSRGVPLRFLRDDMVQLESVEAVSKLRAAALRAARESSDKLSAAAQKNAAAFARRVSAEAQRATRALIRKAIGEGIDVYSSAKLVRQFAGMNGPQGQAALAYRRELVATGLSPAKVSAALDKYIARKVQERANAMASFETRSTVEEGQRQAWIQARANGEIPATSERVWTITPTACSRVCQEMEGQARALDKAFTLPDGEKVMGPPAHAHCACGTILMVRRHRKVA